MASVTFPPSLGGDGSTVTDDSNPTTGLANGGHRTRFIPALSQLVAVANGGVSQSTTQVSLATTQANNALASANAAAASAATALNAPGTSATSTSSLTVGTGSKSLTVQTAKNFVVGQPVMIARTSAPSTTWMAGNITAYNSGTGALTVDVVWTYGSGTHTDWTISLAAPANPMALNKAGDTATGPITIPDDVSVIGTNTNAAKGKTYVLTASLTLTLPTSPAAGDYVKFVNRSATATATIARNGSNIMSLAEDMTLDTEADFGMLVYTDATRGWVLV